MPNWDIQTVHGDVEIFCRKLRLRQTVRGFRRHPVRVIRGLILSRRRAKGASLTTGV